MARIHGIEPGLVPSLTPASVAEPAQKVAADCRCAACLAIMPDKAKGWADMEAFDDSDDDEVAGGKICFECRKFFGTGYVFGGVTKDTPNDVKRKMAKIADGAEWAMILHTRSFTAPGGQSFTVERGDFFKIKRAGLVDWPSELSSAERSMKNASIDISVGPITLTLFTHEFAPEYQTYILSLMADNELELKYICQEDEIGYYTLTPHVREYVQSVFGNG